jgi:hypothetical protein
MSIIHWYWDCINVGWFYMRYIILLQSMASDVGRVPEINTSDAPTRVHVDNNR